MRTLLRSIVVAISCAPSLVVLACGSSDGDGASPGNGPSGMAGTSGSSGSAEAGPSSSASGGQSPDGPTGGHVGIDIGGNASSSSSSSSGAQPEIDASAPACLTIDYSAHASTVACNTGRAGVAPGGVITEGTYVVSAWWGCNGFDEVKGTALVYSEAGVLMMRFKRREGPDLGGNTYQDTWKLETKADGTLSRSTSCGPGNDVVTEVGTFTMGTYLTFRFAEHDERWALQPL